MAPDRRQHERTSFLPLVMLKAEVKERTDLARVKMEEKVKGKVVAKEKVAKAG